MTDIIDFRLVRFESLLIKFAKTNEIPNEFLDGTMDLEYLSNKYKDILSEYHSKIVTKLKRLLTSKIKKSAKNVLVTFMEEYFYFYTITIINHIIKITFSMCRKCYYMYHIIFIYYIFIIYIILK